MVWNLWARGGAGCREGRVLRADRPHDRGPAVDRAAGHSFPHSKSAIPTQHKRVFAPHVQHQRRATCSSACSPQRPWPFATQALLGLLVVKRGTKGLYVKNTPAVFATSPRQCPRPRDHPPHKTCTRVRARRQVGAYPKHARPGGRLEPPPSRPAHFREPPTKKHGTAISDDDWFRPQGAVSLLGKSAFRSRGKRKKSIVAIRTHQKNGFEAKDSHNQGCQTSNAALYILWRWRRSSPWLVRSPASRIS